MNAKSLVLAVALSAATNLYADGIRNYEVTVTNITPGQTFTPVLAVTHSEAIALFQVGQPALDELGILAESGNIAPLDELLGNLPDLVHDTATNGGLLGPGESITMTIEGSNRKDRLSFAAMLIPTHDTFVALDSLSLPHRSVTVTVGAYDAGTETNDELCVNIPGPYCMGGGLSPMDEGEGYVHVANGVHGIGDLAPDVFDWRNPVASVTVRRVR